MPRLFVLVPPRSRHPADAASSEPAPPVRVTRDEIVALFARELGYGTADRPAA